MEDYDFPGRLSESQPIWPVSRALQLSGGLASDAGQAGHSAMRNWAERHRSHAEAALKVTEYTTTGQGLVL